jgi:Putative beta-barrel porin 2
MNLCRAGWSALVIAIAGMFPPDASGQGSPVLPSTRVVVLGPLSLYPQIALRDTGTDSNVFHDSTAPRSDLTYSLTPKLYAVVPIGNTRFVGTGVGDLVYYRTYANQRSLTTQLDGRYEVTSPGFRPFASAGYVTFGDRQGYEIDARARQTQKIVTVGTDMDVTPLTAITAWASRSKTSFDESQQYASVLLAEQLNHSTDAVAAGARFRLTPLTMLLIAAEFQRDRFERVPLRDVDSFRVGPNIAIDTGGTLSGDVKAGYRIFTPRDPSLGGYRGLTGSARLHYMLLSVTRFDVEANRDVTFSFDPNQPYYLESGGRFTVTQQVLGPFDIIGIADWRELRNQPVGRTSFDGRREVTTSIGGGVGLQLQSQMRFALTYERTERTSSEPVGRNYEKTRVLGSISYGL